MIEARRIAKSYGDLHAGARLQHQDRPRRPHRHRRSERRRQDDADQSADRRARSRHRHACKLGTNLEIATLDQRRESLDPEASVATTLTGGQRRHGDHRRRAAPRHRLHEGLPVQAGAGADPGQGAVGRRARAADARPVPWRSPPTSWCSTSPPTTSTSRRSISCRRCSPPIPARCILVSHDRDFLDRTVTSVIAFEGEGRWIEYAGGYSDMVAQRGSGVGALPQEKPAAPKRDAAGAGAAPRGVEPRKRLSPTEQHALKTAPARIEALNDEIRRLEACSPIPISTPATGGLCRGGSRARQDPSRARRGGRRMAPARIAARGSAGA